MVDRTDTHDSRRTGSGPGSSGAPSLTADENRHSERVTALIRKELASNGNWISFARFMELALYAPGLGYYSVGTRKFGKAGDFVTSPEISALFSRCLATQCAEILTALKGPDILELGAGSGLMAADLLLELERIRCMPQHYLILEVSGELRERQRRTIRDRAPQLMSRVAWIDRLPQKPITGIVLANEVLDAMPVERFRAGADSPESIGVGWLRDGLVAVPRPAEEFLTRHVRAIESSIGRSFADGYISELNPGLRPWLRGLAERLRRGVMLFLDYGLPRREYYHPQRHEGTLACFFRHRLHENPFINVGLQDVTAWVDFTAVAEAAHVSGLRIAGFTTQAQFLLGSGLDEQIALAQTRDLQQQLELARQTKILTLPGEMGERFKVIALARDFDEPLGGFRGRDLRGTL